jgi:hypothetical protein
VYLKLLASLILILRNNNFFRSVQRWQHIYYVIYCQLHFPFCEESISSLWMFGTCCSQQLPYGSRMKPCHVPFCTMQRSGYARCNQTCTIKRDSTTSLKKLVLLQIRLFLVHVIVLCQFIQIYPTIYFYFHILHKYLFITTLTMILFGVNSFKVQYT